MSDRASLKNDATVYMRETKIPDKLRPLVVAQSIENLGESSPYKPLILDIEIDLCLLAVSSSTLYTHLVEYPTNARWIFEEALFDLLRIDFDENNNRLRPCVRLLLRDNFFDKLEDANSVYARSYDCLSGAIRYVLTGLAFSPSDKSAIICAMYRCPDSNCNGHAGRYKSVEELEDTQKERGEDCDYCGTRCIEKVSGREQIRKIMAKFEPAVAFGQSESKTPYRALTCLITDPLAKELELGDMYTLCGRYGASVYEVWGLKRVSFFEVSSALYVSSYPSGIRAIQASVSQAEASDPWSFVRKLSLELGSGMYQREAAASLKVALLLSLASLGCDRCAPILCVGPSVDILEEDAMSYAAKCADRNVRVKFPACGTIEKNGEDTWRHGGSLVLAKTGVCNIGNWKDLKPAQRNELLEVLEDGEFAIGRKDARGTGGKGVAGLPQALPLRTALWTYYTCEKNCGREKSDFPETLVNLFGIPFYTDGNDHTPETLRECFKLMAIAVTKPEQEPRNKVTRTEMIEFLRIVNSIKVTLSEDAVQLTKDYFVACRRVRGDAFPARSIAHMTTLAEAHARLCLRSEATYDDVTAVIYLYEESMRYLYGPTVSDPPPFMEQGADNIGEKMLIFKTWLKNYLKCLV